MNTYLEHKKRKKDFPEVTTELITPEKPIKPTENTKVKQLADNSFPYYTEKTTEAGSTAPRKNATTDPLGLYKTPSVSAEKTTQAVEIETLKELPAPKEEIDLSRDTRYKVTKRSIPYNPADSWLEGNDYTPGNGTQNYIEMQGNLREYLERTQREITELEEKNDQKLKNDGYVSRRLGQIDKLNGMIDGYYDFYDRFKNDLPWWKDPEEMEDELAFLRSEKNALQSLQNRLIKPEEKTVYQTLPYRVSDTPPQMEKLSLTAASPQSNAPVAARVSAAASQPTTSSAGNIDLSAQPAANASAGTQSTTKNSAYTPPTATQEKSLTYWLNRGVGTYNFRDVEMMIPKLNEFLEILIKEYEDRNGKDEFGEKDYKYYVSTTLNHIVETRTGQIDKAISMIDWYIDYITNNHDEVNEVYGGEEIDEILEELKGLRGSITREKIKLMYEQSQGNKYSSESEWYVNTYPEEAQAEYNSIVEQIDAKQKERQTLLSKLPIGVMAAPRNPVMQEKTAEQINAIYAQIEVLDTEIEKLNNRKDELEPYLTQFNTMQTAQEYGKEYNDGASVQTIAKQLDVEKYWLGYYENSLWIHKFPPYIFEEGNAQEIKEIEKTIAEKKANIKKLEEQLSYTRIFEYEELFMADDFEEMSQVMIPEWKHNDPYYHLRDDYNTEGEQIYNYINDVVFELGGSTREMMDGASESKYAKFKYMTEDEVQLYNYIYNTLGVDEATRYAKDLSSVVLHYRDASNNVVKYENGLNMRWGVADAADDFIEKVWTSFSSGAERFGLGIEQLFSEDPIETSKLQYQYQATISNANNAGRALYGTLHKIGNETPSVLINAALTYLGIPIKYVGDTLDIASEVGNAYNEAIKGGYTNIQAFNYATLIGATELCFEFIPEGLKKIGHNNEVWGNIVADRLVDIDNAYKRVVKEIDSELIIGSESALKEMLKPLYQEYIFAEDSNIDFEAVAYEFISSVLMSKAEKAVMKQN